MRLAKFLERNQRFHIQIEEATLKMRSVMQNVFLKKKKTYGSMGKTNFCCGVLPFNIWAI
jgi:hypothetical protein